MGDMYCALSSRLKAPTPVIHLSSELFICGHTTWGKHRPQEGLPPGPATRSAYLAALVGVGVGVGVEMSTHRGKWKTCRCALETVPFALPAPFLPLPPVFCTVSCLYII